MKKIEDNCFDVLRLIAAVIVMLSHSFRWMGVQKPMWMLFTVEGSVGVMMFFGISGFLTMASYERCVNNHESILDFYFKRILRIYPALLCSYVVLTLLNYFVYDINVFTPDYLVYLIKCVVWPANRAFLNGISNGVLWTLPCELIYYMLIPIISRLLRKVNAVGGIILILLLWTINCFDAYLTQYIPGTNFMFFLYEFLIGCFLYRWKEEILDKLANKRFAILLVAAFGILFYLHDFTNVIPARGIMHDPLFGIIVPFITIIVAFSFGKKRMKHDFSYGIYLYHMLIIYTLLAYGIKSAKAFPIIWIGTIGIAVLSSIFIEEKALKLKKYMPSLSNSNHVRCLRLDNRKWRAIHFIIIICMLIVLHSGLVSAVSDASLTEGFKFILFQLVAMILVGYGMASVLIREAKSSIHYFAYSYFLGYCIHILNYFIALPFGLERSLPYLILLEVVASILLLVRNKPDISIQNKEETWLCSVFLIIVTAIRYITLFGRCLLPVNGRIVGNAIHSDQLYGVGNSIEATFGFPLHDFRWYTDTFFYHYFSKIQIAVINLVTDISMIHLENSYITIQTSIMLVVAFYVLLDNLKIKRNIKVWSFIAVFLTTGYEYIAMATYSGHMYVVPTTFDIGLAFAIMVVAVFVDQMNKEFSLPLWIITMLFFAAGLGTKGPCIAVTMFGMGVVCIAWMIQKKYKLALSYGCGFIIIFVAIFFTFLSDGMRAVTGSGNAIEIGTWLKSLQIYEVSSYYFKMLDLGIPVWLSQIGLIAIWLFMVQPCAVFGVLPVLIYKGISKVKPRLENVMLLAMLLFGITIVLISYCPDGFSEMYFIMVTFPFSITYIANSFNELKGNKAGRICCVACIGALTVLGIYRFKEEITPFFIEGYNNLTSNISESPGIDVPNTIRDDEYAAYLWIKDNTEKESLLVSNIYLLPNQRKNYITGCMTERHLWLDGWVFTYFHDEEINYKLEVIKNFYNGKSEELQSLREDGVDYIIHIKEITPDFQLKDEEAEIVYQNEGVVVYKI